MNPTNLAKKGNPVFDAGFPWHMKASRLGDQTATSALRQLAQLYSLPHPDQLFPQTLPKPIFDHD
jgi:hypothetical protein